MICHFLLSSIFLAAVLRQVPGYINTGQSMGPGNFQSRMMKAFAAMAAQQQQQTPPQLGQQQQIGQQLGQQQQQMPPQFGQQQQQLPPQLGQQQVGGMINPPSSLHMGGPISPASGGFGGSGGMLASGGFGSGGMLAKLRQLSLQQRMGSQLPGKSGSSYGMTAGGGALQKLAIGRAVLSTDRMRKMAVMTSLRSQCVQRDPILKMLLMDYLDMPVEAAMLLSGPSAVSPIMYRAIVQNDRLRRMQALRKTSSQCVMANPSLSAVMTDIGDIPLAAMALG